MALQINLYHEIQKNRALKRRDPLKISLYILGAIILTFAAIYVVEMLKMHQLVGDLAKAKAEYDRLAPGAKSSKKEEEELTVKVKKTEALMKRLEGRFYWAPVLAQIMKVVPREVQITRFAGEVPADPTQKCSITLDGLSSGPDPRRVAEDLRTALGDIFKPKYKNVTSTFRTLEDGTETVMLDGKQVQTATFAINVQMNVSEEAAATPPPRKKK